MSPRTANARICVCARLLCLCVLCDMGFCLRFVPHICFHLINLFVCAYAGPKREKKNIILDKKKKLNEHCVPTWLHSTRTYMHNTCTRSYAVRYTMMTKASGERGNEI